MTCWTLSDALWRRTAVVANHTWKTFGDNGLVVNWKRSNISCKAAPTISTDSAKLGHVFV